MFHLYKNLWQERKTLYHVNNVSRDKKQYVIPKMKRNLLNTSTLNNVVRTFALSFYPADVNNDHLFILAIFDKTLLIRLN